MTAFEKGCLLQSKAQEEDKLGLFEEKKYCQCSQDIFWRKSWDMISVRQ